MSQLLFTGDFEPKGESSFLFCGRTKKGIDSRPFFALSGVLEKWEMCP